MKTGYSGCASIKVSLGVGVKRLGDQWDCPGLRVQVVVQGDWNITPEDISASPSLQKNHSICCHDNDIKAIAVSVAITKGAVFKLQQSSRSN